MQEREIEILLTIGAIYSEADINMALTIFEEVGSHVQLLPHLNDYTIKTRLYYNLARTLTILNRLDESNKYCAEGLSGVYKEIVFTCWEKSFTKKVTILN